MKETFDQMCILLDQFRQDAEKALSGNKSAAQRSRKASLQLEALGKRWRKETLSHQ